MKLWVQERLASPDPELPPLKRFKPKYHLPVLNDYRVTADNRYWRYWQKQTWETGKALKSQIDPEVLKQMAIDTGFHDTKLLEQVYNDLKSGANIGCSEEYRVASTATNALSAHEQGEKVSEAICEWIDQGYAIGPMNREDIPFPWIKVSGLMTRPKPNGKVRVILNQSREKTILRK